jgi:hypothetical protein
VSEPTSPTSNRRVSMWKVWCAIAAVTLILVGGSAVFIELNFNSAPNGNVSAPKQ